MRSADELVALVRSRLGERYVLGTLVPYDDPDWHGPWDCAELATWAVRHATGELVGVTVAGDAYSGAWATCAARPGTGPGRLIAAQRMAALGTPAAISPEAAAGTPGAILVRAPSGPRLSGHVAVVVTPAGGTVEAYDTAHGVIASSALRRRWDLGVLVPRLEVTLGWVDLEVPSIVLRVGNRGPGVLRAQRALAERGHDPGPLDSIYGPKTAAAVVAFQRAAHLVPDGELGPITAAQLDLTL